MAGQYASKMLRVYRQVADITRNMFLTSFFKTTPEDITDSEFLEIDIVREDEEIAPVLTDISTGANVVSDDVYTNKQIRPPAFCEQMPFNVYDLLKRVPGITEYEMADANKMAILLGKISNSWRRLTDRIKRTIELQASQILQTGTMTLYDLAGVARYVLDFKPKTSHFPTAAIVWSNTETADPISDLNSLAEVIRNDGLVDPKNVLMDTAAFFNFMQNPKVQTLMRKDAFALGSINPQMLNNGATLQGFIPVGNYLLNIWTYGGRYIPLGSTTKTRYIGANKVVMLPDPADLDFRKCFGGIPTIVDSLPPFNEFLPDRVVIPGAFDFKPRIYVDTKSESMMSEVKSRALLIPVSIDRFGCLSV